MAIPVDICLILPRADLVIAYFFGYHIYACWIFTTGLAVKLWLLRYLTTLSWGKCALADVVMNAASSLAVVPALIAYRILFELVLRGSRGDYDWIAFIPIVTILNAALDTWVLRFAFRQRIGKRRFALLCGANAICMAVTIYGVTTYLIVHKSVE